MLLSWESPDLYPRAVPVPVALRFPSRQEQAETGSWSVLVGRGEQAEPPRAELRAASCPAEPSSAFCSTSWGKLLLCLSAFDLYNHPKLEGCAGAAPAHRLGHSSRSHQCHSLSEATVGKSSSWEKHKLMGAGSELCPWLKLCDEVLHQANMVLRHAGTGLTRPRALKALPTNF